MRICPRALLLLMYALGCDAADRSRVESAASSFEKVQTVNVPALKDIAACIEGQNALLPKARSGDVWLIHFRRGYCMLLNSLLSGDRAAIGKARDELSAAMTRRKTSTSGMTVLFTLARAHASPNAAADKALMADLKKAADNRACSGEPVPANVCKAWSDAAAIWPGWAAYHAEDLNASWAALEKFSESAWGLWVAGSAAWNNREWADAAEYYKKAVQAWSRPTALVDLLSPRADLAAAWYQLGLAQFQAGGYAAAISSFDGAVQAAPGSMWFVFARARSKEMLGLREAALADYAAAAHTGNRFYTGMVGLEREEFTNAETEFSGALESPLGDVPKADVEAWRWMAELRSGKCEAAPEIESASPFFPKAEAEMFELECGIRKAASMEELLALEKTLGERTAALKKSSFAARFADAYAAKGIAAEDRKDTRAAAAAYGKAIEWNPQNTKARFNLGAIYIGDRKYNLAEAEYRALVSADPRDMEARYWLAETILAQHPGSARKTEACGLLRGTLSTTDTRRRTQYAARMAAAACPV